MSNSHIKTKLSFTNNSERYLNDIETCAYLNVLVVQTAYSNWQFKPHSNRLYRWRLWTNVMHAYSKLYKKT